MKKGLFILFMSISYFALGQNIGGQHYVAPADSGGVDLNNELGSFEKPWATFQKAFDRAEPGDTIYFRGGVYHSRRPNRIHPERQISHGVSGTPENWIYYFNYPGEEPILDCELHCSANTDLNYNSGIDIEHAGFMHFRGITIRNVYQCSDVISSAFGVTYSANFIFENITIHNIGQRGWWCFSGAWNEIDMNEGDPDPYFEYDTTRWINCDVYDLCDTFTMASAGPGNAADAWKCHNYARGYFSWEGCRAWFYSDDGIDPSGSGVRSFSNCWLMSGDKYAFIDDIPYGSFEGNGIKTAGTHEDLWPDGDPKEHLVIVRNSLSLFCEGVGFYNNLEGSVQNYGVYYNNTAYKCNESFGTSTLRYGYVAGAYWNNLSHLPRDVNATNRPNHISIATDQYTESNNTWRARWYENEDYEVNAHDFAYGLDSAKLVSLFTAERVNGQLPAFPLSLSDTSDLLNKGYIIPDNDSVTFEQDEWWGDAPDIGAFQYNPNANVCPSIDISSPTDGIIFQEDETISIYADAFDTDGSITNVSLYADDSLIHEVDDEESLTFDWSDVAEGVYIIQAIATDDDECSSPSSMVKIEVGGLLPTDTCKVYPSPTDLNEITLKLREPLPVTTGVQFVSSISGQKYLSPQTLYKDGETIEYVLDVSRLGNGLYHLMFINIENSQYYLPCRPENVRPQIQR